VDAQRPRSHADPAAAEFLGHGKRSAGTAEKVGDEIARIDDARRIRLEKCFRFLCGES
jgi:hypothetical protein